VSNSLAIATVTGALVTRVQGLLNTAGLTGFGVVAGHPRTDSTPGVYLTLYHLSPNAALRNLDLPTRRGDGGASQRPVLALSLRYLFSFIGDAARFEAERLAGLVLTDLHARPILTPEELTTFVNSLAQGHALRASDLARQPEHVKLTPLTMDPEELSRVWGLFNQSIFALSMAWEATAVLLDGRVEPGVALPVATTGLAVRPVSPPTLTALYEATSRQPVVGGADTLVLEGSGLLGERTRVLVGGAGVDVGAADLEQGALRVPLSGVVNLRPGVQVVAVEHQVNVPGAAGDGWRPAGTSNALAVMVRPTLGAMAVATVTGGVEVSIAIAPLPATTQSVELLLDAAVGAARRSSRTFRVVAPDVIFTLADLPAGDWRVRVVVDGASSLPTMTGGVYDGPTLTVP
jgi:hypothetical protein